jgi:hypothetical protein
MSGAERLDELATELDRMSERLADAAMDLLRAGLGDGSEAAAALATTRERLVNRARSSVEKAVRLLAQASMATEATAPVSKPRRTGRAGRAGRTGQTGEDDGSGDSDVEEGWDTP